MAKHTTADKLREALLLLDQVSIEICGTEAEPPAPVALGVACLKMRAESLFECAFRRQERHRVLATPVDVAKAG